MKKKKIYSIVIAAIIIIIGIVVFCYMYAGYKNNVEVYDTAEQITSSEKFNYALKNNISNAFIYGELRASDPVTYPQVTGQYAYIKRVTEQKTRHQRVVHINKTTSVRTYYTWDEINVEDQHCSSISFLEQDFAYGTIPFPQTRHIDTVYLTENTRYVFYGNSVVYTGTVFASLEHNTLLNAAFYENKTIDETIEHLESPAFLVLFWIFWVLLLASVVYIFYNRSNT